MNKSLILFLYGATLWITVSRWYRAGGQGIPDPTTIGPASYLFAILALSADFLEGLPIILAVGLTFILWQRNPPGKSVKPVTTTLAGKTNATPAKNTFTVQPTMNIGRTNKNTKGVGA